MRRRRFGPAIEGSGDWSSYWYDGRIDESDMTRGLIIWNLSDKAVASAKKFDRVKPQTQEITFPFKGTPTAPASTTGGGGREPPPPTGPAPVPFLRPARGSDHPICGREVGVGRVGERPDPTGIPPWR